MEGMVISWETKQKLTGISRQSQTAVLNSNSGSIRSLYNIPDNGPDPRGRARAFTRDMSGSLGEYIDLPEENVSLEDRSAPWKAMAEESGLELPKTKHENPETGEYDHYEEIEPKPTQD